MARADLTAMLGRLEDEPTSLTLPQTAPEPVAQTAPTATTPRPKVSKPESTKTASRPAAEIAAPSAQTQSDVTQKPLFLRLERKETRLRADQYADLTTHARRLSQAKATGGERITENTLIRVAIDLLLEHGSDLAGQTEAEIRNSVTRDPDHVL
jgi:hypothetical protein